MAVFLIILLLLACLIGALDGIRAFFMFVGLIIAIFALKKGLSHMEDDNIYHNDNDKRNDMFR